MQKIFEVIMKKETSSKYQSFGKFKAVVISDFDYIYEIAIPEYKKYLSELKEINFISMFKRDVSESILFFQKKLDSCDLDDQSNSIIELKIKSAINLLKYNSEKEIFKHCKKELNWFLEIFFSENPNRREDIISNLLYLRFMENEFWNYCNKFNRENILKNHLYDDIILMYSQIGVNILVEDVEFYKNKINSMNENTTIICNQANRYLVDKRLKINFCLPTPRFLLEALSNYYDSGLIKKLAFRIDQIREGFLVFDSFDHGAKLRNNISSLPDLSRLFDLDNYQNALWVKHNRIKKHLTFEETCDDFELFGDNVVTQLVHLEYFIENGQYYIRHLDHEYIIYSLDEYDERLRNSESKGHRKIKTFKIDESCIPFFKKYKNEYFLFIVLNSYFSNKGLLKEYFEEIS
ncbi:hypothetical protein E0H86_09200 [Acinetobacter sp. ANC 4635]|uniref:hypothetical protein n=1 Tax=Acinetobacter sp. ANC 4635 TaxID=2529846 RepID=UPI00103BDD04|nr:hypothetical protein [Acinetobacter sp. ANC 4635]TCB30891.1 hypothetical protein E0H86_09200 [Acinetobacter sp. ANC 4635]